MKRNIALAGATLALGVAPALALAAGRPNHPGGIPSGITGGAPSTVTMGGQQAGTVPSNPGTSHRPSNPGGSHRPSTPGPKAGLPTKARAYGKYCDSESRKHVQGQPGTPFSASCVTAMAKVAKGDVKNPRTACQGESRKHVKGTRGTPFSQCVSGAAKLLENSAGGSAGSGSTTTSTTTTTPSTTTSTTPTSTTTAG